MKLQVLVVLGICLVQMCFESVNGEMTIDQQNDLKKRIHDHVGDVSQRFIDDALTIYDKFEDADDVRELMSDSNIFWRVARILKNEHVSKIDVDSIKKFKIDHPLQLSAEDLARSYDALLTFQSILSKRVPSKIANNVMNLLFAISFPNATIEDMENAVNYLYSNETVVIKDPFRNFRTPNASECPKMANRYSAVQDKLKALTFIKPSVLEDVAIIIEKFPCSRDEIPRFLVDFVEIIIRLQSIAAFEKKPISACLVKEHSKLFDSFEFFYKAGGTSYHGNIARDHTVHQLKLVDLILATRLTDERSRGIINFETAVVYETPIDEIQKALEYAFVDVAPPVAECSTEEHDDRFLDASFYRNFRSQFNKNGEEFELSPNISP